MFLVNPQWRSDIVPPLSQALVWKNYTPFLITCLHLFYKIALLFHLFSGYLTLSGPYIHNIVWYQQLKYADPYSY